MTDRYHSNPQFKTKMQKYVTTRFKNDPQFTETQKRYNFNRYHSDKHYQMRHEARCAQNIKARYVRDAICINRILLQNLKRGKEIQLKTAVKLFRAQTKQGPTYIIMHVKFATDQCSEDK